jgi:hypothetical protein
MHRHWIRPKHQQLWDGQIVSSFSSNSCSSREEFKCFESSSDPDPKPKAKKSLFPLPLLPLMWQPLAHLNQCYSSISLPFLPFGLGLRVFVVIWSSKLLFYPIYITWSRCPMLLSQLFIIVYVSWGGLIFMGEGGLHRHWPNVVPMNPSIRSHFMISFGSNLVTRKVVKSEARF